MRLLNRTTRNVATTEAGERLLQRLKPAFSEIGAAVDSVNSFRGRPAGTLRINVPVNAARLVLPTIIPALLGLYPDIWLEVLAEHGLIDLIETRCDAGIRYDDSLEKDMVAVPIGPRHSALRRQHRLDISPAMGIRITRVTY